MQHNMYVAFAEEFSLLFTICERFFFLCDDYYIECDGSYCLFFSTKT